MAGVWVGVVRNRHMPSIGLARTSCMVALVSRRHRAGFGSVGADAWGQQHGDREMMARGYGSKHKKRAQCQMVHRPSKQPHTIKINT